MLSIRRVAPDDTASLRLLSDQALVGEDVVLQVNRSGIGIRYQPAEPAEWRSFPPQPEAGLRLNSGDAVLFGAFREEGHVGSLVISPRQGGWAELLDLRVDVPVRRQGIATELLAAAERFVRKAGVYGIRLIASDQNPSLCRFAERSGFRLAGMDTLALAANPAERQKPLRQRACALIFYKTNLQEPAL